MTGLSKLAVALTAVFAVSVTTLIALFVCVKWRQRQSRRRSLSTGNRQSNSGAADASSNYFYTPSKVLLYFFCWKNQSRVEPDQRDPEARPDPAEAEEIDDILKWHSTVLGPPRFLFTISEDQEREADPESDGVNNGVNNGASAPPAEEVKKRVSLTLRECLAEAEAEDDEAAAGTPFSTPCASPPYFTPSPSSAREHHATRDAEETADFDASGSEATKFISLEIRVEEINPL